MANFKLSLMFRQFDNGWSENFFLQSTAPPAALEAGIRNNLIPAAVPFRSPTVVLQGFRLVDLAQPRRAINRVIGVSYGHIVEAGASPDVVRVCARAAIASDGGPSRNIWIRGLKDVDTKRFVENGSTDQGPLLAAIRNYLTQVRTLGGCVRYLRPAVDASPLVTSWHDVLSLKPHVDNGGWTQFVIRAGDAAPQLGQIVTFRNLPNPTFLNLRGQFRVVNVDNENKTYAVPCEWRLQGGAQPQQNTQWRVVAYDFAPFLAPTGNYELSTHLTGGPTRRPRGRRSPVTRRRFTRAG